MPGCVTAFLPKSQPVLDRGAGDRTDESWREIRSLALGLTNLGFSFLICHTAVNNFTKGLL